MAAGLEHPALRDAPDRAPPPGEAAPPARFAGIDVLRGLAILWVVLFHLWGDIVFFPPAPAEYYRRFWGQLGEAGAWPVFTSITDIFFRDGYQGVPLFMMLSGLTLTIAAHRAGAKLRWPSFQFQRFRKLLVPYWFGCAFAMAVMAIIAYVRIHIHGGDFLDTWTNGITTAKHARVVLDWGMALAAFTGVPRIISQHWFFAPSGALWFVVLLAQYYALFPLMYAVMRRTGSLPLLALTLAVTLVSRFWMLTMDQPLEVNFRFVNALANFRIFEFALGMAIGQLLASGEPAHLLRLLRSWPAVVACVAVGFAVHTAGDMIDMEAGYLQTFDYPLIIAGLALMGLPLLVGMTGPGPLVLRPVAFVGVISYAVLIVNDPLRMVASELRNEGVAAGWWWFFLIIYVPASILLAWPLATVLGLMPKKSSRAPARREKTLRLPELRPRPLVLRPGFGGLALRAATPLALTSGVVLAVAAHGDGSGGFDPLSPSPRPDAQALAPESPSDVFVQLSCLDATGDGRLDRNDAWQALPDLDNDGREDEEKWRTFEPLDIAFAEEQCVWPEVLADVSIGPGQEIEAHDCAEGPSVLLVGIGGSGTNPRDLSWSVSRGVKDTLERTREQLASAGVPAQVIYANPAVRAAAQPHPAMEQWLTHQARIRLELQPCLRVAVMGHSYGGATATSVAAALETAFPGRVMAVTVDRTTALYGRANPPVPEVAPWLNIFQTNEGWHGSAIAQRNVVNVDDSLIAAPARDGGGRSGLPDHANLDDAQLAQDQALFAIVTWAQRP